MFETIKMQVYFDTNFPVQMDFLRAEKQAKAPALNILREIHEAKMKTVPAIEGGWKDGISHMLNAVFFSFVSKNRLVHSHHE